MGRHVTGRAGVISGQTVTVTNRRTLKADGNEMLLETIVVVQHGYEFGVNNSKSTDVYTRMSR